MNYISKNRRYAVNYRGMSRPGYGAGGYDVLKVVGGVGSKDWPVISDRDWLREAVEIADRLDEYDELGNSPPSPV